MENPKILFVGNRPDFEAFKSATALDIPGENLNFYDLDTEPLEPAILQISEGHLGLVVTGWDNPPVVFGPKVVRAAVAQGIPAIIYTSHPGVLQVPGSEVVTKFRTNIAEVRALVSFLLAPKV